MAGRLLAHHVTGDSGRPVLLLHGLGGDRRQLRELAGTVFGGAYRVIAADLRGHGDTGLSIAVSTLTFDQLAEDVEALLLRLDALTGLVVVGVSMGAGVTMELLARDRVDIAAAVLLRPAWEWALDPPNLAPFPVIGALLHQYGPTDGRDRFAASADFAAVAAVSPAAAEALLAQFDAPSAVARAERLICIPHSAPNRPDSTTLPPRLIVGSELDPVHPLSIARRLHHDLGGDGHGWFSVAAPRYDAPARHASDVAAVVGRFVDDTVRHARTS